MQAKAHTKIRENVKGKLPDNTVVFFFSGQSVRKSADASYPFHTNRNFYYLTGIDEPAAVLAIDTTTGKEKLFLREVDELQEKWVGHYMRDDEARALSGITDIVYFDAFIDYVNEVLESDKRIGFDKDHDTYQEDIHGSALSFASQIDEERLVDVSEILVRARMIKTDDEVAAIKAALTLTKECVAEMIDEIRPGNNENDVVARFEFAGKKHFGVPMFETILAGGKRACVLHYIKNDQELKDGELVLCDLGMKLNHYGADITRTYPVNGVFTSRQKEIYNLVLDTFYAVEKAIRPGVSLRDLQELAKETLAQGAKRLGIIKSVDDIADVYYHGVGHSLGLDTHDVWISRDALLEPGNVITNEPGLYIAGEGIGIRIESDFLVTETGCLDLGPDIPKTVEEIETVFRNRN